MPDSNLFRDVWLQIYIHETISYSFGGAISVKASNVPVTIIEDTLFESNLGDIGGAISFDQGGGLYCLRCTFEIPGDLSLPEKYQHLIRAWDQMNPIVSDTSDYERRNL